MKRLFYKLGQHDWNGSRYHLKTKTFDVAPGQTPEGYTTNWNEAVKPKEKAPAPAPVEETPAPRRRGRPTKAE